MLDTQIETPSMSRIETDLVRGHAMIEAAMDRRETFERAAVVARDYSAMAKRIFAGSKDKAEELADQIVKNEVALDGGCDAVLLRDDDLAKVLRNLRALEATTAYLPEEILVDVTAIVDDEPHIDGFETIRWLRDAIVRGRMGAVLIRCVPQKLEEVEGRWLLTLGVEGEVQP